MIELYEHQKLAVEKLHNGSILVGDVGTGKSLTGLSYYFTKVCGGKMDGEHGYMSWPKDLYIITTAKKRDSLEWESELSYFLLSTKAENNTYYPDAKVVVDSWNNIEKYKNVENAFFIFDEQRLVGYGTWAKTFIKISKTNEWILLSATPGDSWSDYRAVFIANGFFRNKYQFEREHCVFNPYVKFPVIQRYINTDYLIKCQRKILVNMKYLKKTKRHHIRIMTKYDSDKYDIIFKKRWNPYTNEPCKQISEVCYALRRVCNEDISKIEEIIQIFNTHKKAIIFYNFDYELEMLKKMCDNNKILYSEWNGHKHQALPNDQEWLYFVQYSAGCEGWNCIETDTIIFMSQTYSYKTLIQAEGRIDRLNTPFSDLYYYHLQSMSLIDKSIANSLRGKKKFNEMTFINSTLQKH